MGLIRELKIDSVSEGYGDLFGRISIRGFRETNLDPEYYDFMLSIKGELHLDIYGGYQRSYNKELESEVKEIVKGLESSGSEQFISYIGDEVLR